MISIIPILVLLLLLLSARRYPHTYRPKRPTDSSTGTGTNHIERVENVILLYVALKDEGV